MKISTKLLMAVSMPLLSAFLIGSALIFSYLAIARVQQNGDIVRQIRSSITDLNHLIFSYVSYRGERPKQQFLAEYKKMTELLARVHLRDQDQQQLLEEIRLNSQSMRDSFLRLASKTDLPGQTGITRRPNGTEELLVGQLLIRSHNADSTASILRNLVDADIEKTQKTTLVFIFLALILATIPVVVVLTQVRKRTTTALIKLRPGTQIVSAGNLDHIIAVERPDEI
jgi:HAMP domain-containing protein